MTFTFISIINLKLWIQVHYLFNKLAELNLPRLSHRPFKIEYIKSNSSNFQDLEQQLIIRLYKVQVQESSLLEQTLKLSGPFLEPAVTWGPKKNSLISQNHLRTRQQFYENETAPKSWRFLQSYKIRM